MNFLYIIQQHILVLQLKKKCVCSAKLLTPNQSLCSEFLCRHHCKYILWNWFVCVCKLYWYQTSSSDIVGSIPVNPRVSCAPRLVFFPLIFNICVRPLYGPFVEPLVVKSDYSRMQRANSERKYNPVFSFICHHVDSMRCLMPFIPARFEMG